MIILSVFLVRNVLQTALRMLRHVIVGLTSMIMIVAFCSLNTLVACSSCVNLHSNFFCVVSVKLAKIAQNPFDGALAVEF